MDGRTPARRHRAGSLERRSLGEAIALVFLALACVGPVAARAASPDIAVTDGRMQVIIASRPAAGYFTMTNHGQQPLSLTGASAPDCGSIMLHRSFSQGGLSRMEMVPSVNVPSGGSVQFAPGGYHLMCMEPRGVLLTGKGTEPVSLHFSDGNTIEAPFTISTPAK